MARRSAEVTWKRAEKDRIPEELGEGVTLVVDLERRRKTWRQHFLRYALDPDARVGIRITGGDPVR